ncbi:hypothetical protein D3C76_585260 [compost metagenome]|uniref:hypothetical protein n=1 Tax=Pseudomonas TaxID=286 RepID=UPI000F51BD0E|nr:MULTISPECIES: hypothetical protein [Pseudomonas]ELE9769115.1 hypothetical protein [Pseudomonas aeruginosa]ELE9775526.1 hypothetical protein [Pseudomonas aeruginosa]MCV3804652.1 hypothetical protein [Pseudomonas aeruginosa]MCV3846549.1 hypothetical protein [Pseudomonas aeruginosa]MCV3864698.1 hypothetical protein [Pseudomonas aeruginosa]
MDADNVALAGALKIEAAKAAPFGASLVLWGLTLQEWTLVFGCLYAACLFLDLVGRRWLIPLIRLAWKRRGVANEKPD